MALSGRSIVGVSMMRRAKRDHILDAPGSTMPSADYVMDLLAILTTVYTAVVIPLQGR